MKSVRRGNDISVTWSLFQDGNPFFAEGQDIAIYLDSAFKKEKITTFTVNGNVLSWIFWGKDQKTTGRYSLRLVLNENKPCMATVDQCDFVNIVTSSCSAGGDNPEDVITEYVSLSSNVNFVTGGAYDDAELREMIEGKVDKVIGKQLSSEDFTSALKEKLEGLSNYDDTEIENAISELLSQFNVLLSKNVTTAIESFNEIISFLDGIKDSQSLSGIIASIERQISSKQDILKSGKSIKTINGKTILGEGNIELATKEEFSESNDEQLAYIMDNKTRIDATATEVLKLIDDVNILNGEGDGSVKDVVSKEIAHVIASAPDDLDKLREIADFIEADSLRASEIVSSIDELSERVQSLETESPFFEVIHENIYEMLPEKEDKLYFLYSE